MAEVNQNATIYRGDSARIIVSGIGADVLTGASIFWTLYALDEIELVEKSSENGIAIEDDTITVALSSIETDLPPNAYEHKAWIVDAQGQRSRILSGRLTIKE